MKKAFLFDLNGTMINDMEYHIKAWHGILNNELGADLNWQEVKSQMYGKNAELLERVFGKNHFTSEQAEKISLEKEKRYQQEYRPHLQLIPGLQAFLQKAYALKIPMAIGSAAITFNIDFVLDNLDIRHYFPSIVSADDVLHSKPDPETYVMAARQLNMEPAGCIVFEDAPKGVEAAINAGMDCIVITTLHTQEEFSDYPGILRFINDYTGLHPAALMV